MNTIGMSGFEAKQNGRRLSSNFSENGQFVNFCVIIDYHKFGKNEVSLHAFRVNVSKCKSSTAT